MKRCRLQSRQIHAAAQPPCTEVTTPSLPRHFNSQCALTSTSISVSINVTYQYELDHKRDQKGALPPKRQAQRKANDR